MGISATPSPSGPKRRLADTHDSSESEDEPPRKKSKKSKKSKKRLEIFDEKWECQYLGLLLCYVCL